MKTTFFLLLALFVLGQAATTSENDMVIEDTVVPESGAFVGSLMKARKDGASLAAEHLIDELLVQSPETISLLEPEVSEMAGIIDQWVLGFRKGCAIPDPNALNYPVTGVTKEGTSYILKFGSPQNPNVVTYSATVLSHKGGFVVSSTSPRPCAIGRETEDSPEREVTITPHQRAVADVLIGKVGASRKVCKLSPIDMTKSKILAVSEQTVAGTGFIFRLQLQDKTGITDVAVIKATMPAGSMGAKDTKIDSVLPDACELFPQTEVPVEDPKDKKSLAQYETERIELINSQGLSWTAGKHEDFDSDLEFTEWADAYTGVKEDKAPMMTTTLVDDGAAIEQNFDWRKRMPKCVNSDRVRNQGSCGSCYAFAKTGMLSHRMCIQSNGKNIKVLSPGYMASCPYEGLSGCGGGIPRYSGKFLIDKGVPEDQCVPYKGGDSSHTYCRHHCKPRRTKQGKVIRDPWTKYHAAEGSHARIIGERQIQLAIKAGGPVEGGMKVFDTFKVYKSGVYFHPEPPKCKGPMDLNCCTKHRYCHRFWTFKEDPKTKKMVKGIKEVPQKSGGHAYMIVGWGEFPKGATQDEMETILAETTAIPADQRRKLLQWHTSNKATNKYGMAGKKFWICENSWGKKWAHGGFFFMERGIDTCEVESGGAYVVQPGNAVKFKDNSRCQCNGHGDLATKAVRILTGVENKGASNKCRCDMGWGGKTCDTFCPDSEHKGSHFCTACNDMGDCQRCRAGKKKKEKQVLGDGKCWHTCKATNAYGPQLGERLRVGGICGTDKTFPCMNSKTTVQQYAKNPVCVCNKGFTGKRCQYKAACFTLSGDKCAACTDSSACNTPSCSVLPGVYPAKCASACSGNGKFVMKTYKSQCVCNVGFAGNECQLDCTKAAKGCQACSVAGVCLVHTRTTTINQCIKADGGANAKTAALPMVLNDFSAALWMKGSNYQHADVFTWSGLTSTGGSITSDMGTGQVAAKVTPTDFLTVKVSYATQKAPYGKLTIVYNAGDSPISHEVPITGRALANAIHPNKWQHIAVVVTGMDRKLTVYMDGKVVKTFDISEYPIERLQNLFNIGRSGFWGVASGVQVANTAFTAAQIAGFASTRTALADRCNEKCNGCKGKCLYGTCVCPTGFGGTKCDQKMVLATFKSPVEDPYHSIKVQSHQWGGRSVLPMEIAMPSASKCSVKTADIQAIRMTVFKNPDFKEKQKCYNTVGQKNGKYVKVVKCVGDGVIMQLSDGMLELGIPGKENLAYNYKSVKEWGSFMNKPSNPLSIKPDWRTPLIGQVPLSGNWVVAWAQQSALSTGKIALSKIAQWQIQASIDIVVPEECASKAASKSSKYTARSPPSEPKSPCYPQPCGEGGSCKLYTHAGAQHKCTCMLGWDQSGRTQIGFRTNADEILPCDTNGASLLSCPTGHHAVLKNCLGLSMHRSETTKPGQQCGRCVPDDHCVKCITVVGKSYHVVNGAYKTGLPTQQCRFVDLRVNKDAKKAKTITKAQAEAMVREDDAKTGKDLNDISPSQMTGSAMCA